MRSTPQGLEPLRTLAPLTMSAALLSSCCAEPAGDVLLVNNTPAPVTFTVESTGDSTVVEPGRLGLLSTDPGRHVIRSVVAGTSHEQPVTTALDAVALVSADPSQCYAVVDYTPQYKDASGAIEVLAVVEAGGVGRLAPADLAFLTGPRDIVPAEVYPNAIVRRVTLFPCELAGAEPARLTNHLARLP